MPYSKQIDEQRAWFFPGRHGPFFSAALFLGALAPGVLPAQTTDSASEVTVLKQMSIDELMDLQVTSVSKRPEKWLDAPAAIEVITSEDIRRSGASSIPEALRLAPNLAVVQKGSHSWGISARGFNTELANKLLVLIDGRAVYTPLYSGVFWERQDYLLADLDRIEVISGPGGALWGANAVNGVVNITSKSARDTQGFYAEAGAGTQLEGFGGARYGGRIAPNVFFRVYGKYTDRDAGVLANGTDARDSWHLAQGGFRLDATTAAQDTITVQGDIYDSRQGVTLGGSARERGHNLLGRWSRTLAGGSNFALQLYYDQTHFSTPTAAFVAASGVVLAPAGTLVDDLDTYDLDFQHTLKAGARHQLVWGLGYRFTHDDVGNSPGLAFLPAELDQDLASGFVQDEIKLRDNLSLTVGTKVEHNDYTGFEWEPSARLQWKLNERQMVWGAASRAVRMPSRIDRHLSQAAPPHFVLLAGGPGFTSETVLAYELGYRAQLTSQLTASVSAFYNQYDDIRSTSLSPVTVFPLFFANNVEGETHGLELSFTYQATERWRLQGGYNLLREDLRVKPGQFDFSNAHNETADPENQLTLRSSLDLPSNWEWDVAWRWVDNLVVNNASAVAEVPAYSELDVRLAWHPTPAIELSLVGQNLLHARHPEFGFPGPTREEIKRNVYAKISWRY
jgi:iron complex outermembrane receptor protein